MDRDNSTDELRRQVAELHQRLEEAERTLEAIRQGEVDAVIVSSADGERVFALEGADYPYRILVQTMNQGALTLSWDGLVLYSNQQFADLVLRPLEEVIGASIDEFVIENEIPVLDALLERAKHERSSSMELTLQVREGAHIPVYVSFRSLEMETPTLSMIVTDLTEQKQSRERDKMLVEEHLARRQLQEIVGALRLSEERFRVALAGTPITVFHQDRALRYTWIWSRDGIYSDAFLGKTDEDLLPAEEATELHTLKAQVLETRLGVRREIVLRFPPGEWRWWDLALEPLHDASGELIGITGAALDITARKEADHKIQESEIRYRLLADAMPQIVFTARPDGSRETVNRRWHEYTGESAESSEADRWPERVHPDDRASTLSIRNEAYLTGTPYEVEFRFKRADGQYRWHLARATPMRNERGEIVRWIGTSTDIHDLRQANEAVAEANQRKDEFLAMLAHELRNPLAPIRNAIGVMRLTGPTNPILEQARDSIDRQVTHMVHLVDDLLEVSRIVSGKITIHQERLDLVELVRNTITDHASLFDANELGVEVDLPDEPLWIHGDATRISQVVGNLLLNAAKFTDPGGRVSVGIDLEPGHAVIRVRDTGIGIVPELLTGVFEGFTQADHSLDRSRGGLGLGLAVVKGLVELHGGTVEARSEGPGRGSEFRVALPVIQTPAARGATPCEALPAASCRVLLIEDYEEAARMMSLLLKLCGHQVAVARSGAAGLEMASQFRPQVVFCDIGLPDGMDGYAVARAFREDPAFATVPLVALTGYGREEDRRLAFEAGFDLHLTKPVEPSALYHVLSELTDTPATESTPGAGELQA